MSMWRNWNQCQTKKNSFRKCRTRRQISLANLSANHQLQKFRRCVQWGLWRSINLKKTCSDLWKMCRHFLSRVIKKSIFNSKNFTTVINENLGHQEDIYKEQLMLEYMIPVSFPMCGFNMIMAYNFAISMRKIFIGIQVLLFRFFSMIVSSCYNLIKFLLNLDYADHQINPGRFFKIDLAIISFPEAFELNERIMPICLPYNTGDDGNYLKNIGLTISGKFIQISSRGWT